MSGDGKAAATPTALTARDNVRDVRTAQLPQTKSATQPAGGGKQGLTSTQLANNAAANNKKPPTEHVTKKAWYHWWF